MVICRLMRPIQNPHSPPTVLVLDGSQSSAAAIPHPSLSLLLLLLLWWLRPLSRRLVWQPFQARKHTAPLGFSFSEHRRRRPPRMTPANTECLPADSCALPNYQILKSAVTHPHFSSRFILRGKGGKNSRQTEAHGRSGGEDDSFLQVFHRCF